MVGGGKIRQQTIGICTDFLAYLSSKQEEQPVLSCSSSRPSPGREGGAPLGKAVASGGSELTGTAPAVLSSPNPPLRLPSPQPSPTPAGHVAVTRLSQRDGQSEVNQHSQLKEAQPKAGDPVAHLQPTPPLPRSSPLDTRNVFSHRRHYPRKSL